MKNQLNLMKTTFADKGYPVFIGASLIGWLLAAAGYKAALEVQPASVDTAIFVFGIYIPLALFVIMFILLKKYDLEKRYPEIVAELQKRKETE